MKTYVYVFVAAQFFWQNDLKDKTIRDDSKLYKIAVGKYTRSISKVDNNSTQIIDVNLIYLEKNYRDSANYFANDIAIIGLKNNAIMSSAVMPVCIDWINKYSIPNGSIGKIVGWGMTEIMTPSPVLLELFLPYLNHSTCKELNLDQPYITSDKFCGLTGKLFRGGEAGFGGAGLTFAQNNLHFLSGIMSIRYKGKYELLTDVSQHIPWIRSIFLKNSNCGHLFTPHEDINTAKEKYGSAPWNVGVYRKNNTTQEYVMISGGTLIAPNLVATAAQFFWQNNLKDKIVTDNVQLYKTAVGKYTRNISKVDNEATQIIDVNSIYLEDNYEDSSGYYANDIAIIVLKNNVIISDAVMPVCIDWNRKYTIPSGSIGKIVGWGLTKNNEPSNELLELTLPYTDRITCGNLNTVLQRYVTSDKFCALKGQEFLGGEAGFGGAGLTFADKDGLHFLSGIMSITFRGTIEILTDISKHIPWIYNKFNEMGIELQVGENNYNNENISIEQVKNPVLGTTSNSLRSTTSSSVSTESSTQVTCMIPFTEGSTYSIFNRNSNANQVLRPETQVPLNSKVEETCVKGYYKVQTFRRKQMKCDENGEWFPPLNESEPLCLRKCPPLKSDSLDLICTFNGREVDCADQAINGTTVKPKCKVTHSLQGGQLETPMVSICLPNGSWSQKLYSCILNCGKRTAVHPSFPLIIEGVNSKFGSAPWNVGVYAKVKDNNYELRCGGTLISKNLIISAATSFSKTGSKHYISVKNGLYKVAVAKYTRDISIKDNQFTQIIGVRHIYLEDNYFGSSGHYANDIAIIVLTNDVDVSHFVLPACIDWTARNPVPDKSKGMIVGWEKTEKAENNKLMEATLPYIDRIKCVELYQKINEDFKIFLTADKFCAGSESGQGVDRGDGGFGITFEHSGLHYLTGISTIKDAANNSYSVFTNVGYHIEWIKSIVDDYNKIKEPIPRK
ncbi:Hypothetical protein CINCED_3A014439 [Cinara cedri]|uniref:Peptidase S1, PA clan,Serine proteases, trypsin family, histidine active site,Serine proteases, trypsin n=1 Tax=Cinara cedri TaxID=506608 RepID=A0A5E4N561_9HEMI|nr:Hypothetical protein CINCED_3A014439 [Cinara cedri]